MLTRLLLDVIHAVLRCYTT